MEVFLSRLSTVFTVFGCLAWITVAIASGAIVILSFGWLVQPAETTPLGITFGREALGWLLYLFVAALGSTVLALVYFQVAHLLRAFGKSTKDGPEISGILRKLGKLVLILTGIEVLNFAVVYLFGIAADINTRELEAAPWYEVLLSDPQLWMMVFPQTSGVTSLLFAFICFALAKPVEEFFELRQDTQLTV